MSISVDEMKEAERAAEGIGLSSPMMMENAGRAVAQNVKERFDEGSAICVVCGRGNNGGDGLAAARHLRLLGYEDLTVYVIGERTRLTAPGPSLMLSLYERLAPVSWVPASEFDPGRYDVILDAIFGTGVRDGVEEPYRTTIERINGSTAFVIAIDIPSGVNPDDGSSASTSVRADLTVTFHKAKRGLLINRENVGTLRVEEIGIPFGYP